MRLLRARPPVLVAGVALTLFGVLAVLLARHGWRPYPAEAALHAWVLDLRPGLAVRIAGAVTDLGTGVPPYAAAVTAGLLLARDPAPVGRRLARACAPVLVLALGQLLRRALVEAFARPRPPMSDWVRASPGGYAFPSGHAFTAALAAALLGWAVVQTVRRRRATAAALALMALAAAVGLTRIYFGVHWPLDVAGGWLLAIGWFALAVPFLRRVRQH
ncbi:phosphatase PAP2 family protein [Kitasatospora sp. NPDC002040]|uniref:phosphatase PAP2 family protein n=1 Tax=Kitasatospora sp. NPDC002040 TaxID=3154661 RepID=UPI003319AEF2